MPRPFPPTLLTMRPIRRRQRRTVGPTAEPARAPFRAFKESARGTAAIEFALVAPLLVLLLVGTTELGLAIRDADRVQQAAAAGAAFAVEHGWDSAGIAAAVASGSGAQGVSASPAPALFCGCPQAAGITATDCSVTCADGSGARQYVRVSATLARTSLMASALPLPANLTRQSVARLQ